MQFLQNTWHYIVQIHQGGDWAALVGFYAIVLALILLVWLQVWLVRGRKLSYQALERSRELTDSLLAVRGEIDELERRTEKRLDSRAGDLDARMTKKMDQKGDLIQERVEQRASDLLDTIHRLESRVSRASEDVGRFRERIDDVERRIPNLFDRLDDFRDALGRTFQVEISSVLSSFDSSLTSILQQMKSDLQLGLSRVESLETMVRSRERAEKSLLGTPEGTPAPLPGSLEEEEQEFAEWEEEAKALADTQGARPEAVVAEEDEPVESLLEAIAVDEEADEKPGPRYPAEMAEPDDEEDEQDGNSEV